MRKLAQAGQPEFVLHDAVLQARIFAELGQRERFFGGRGGGLFAVHMLAGFDGFFHKLRAQKRAGGVEENFVLVVLEDGIDIGGPLEGLTHPGSGSRPCVSARCWSLLALRPVRIGSGMSDEVVADFDPALLDDGEDGADQVLIGAHAAGDAVQDDADATGFHGWSPLGEWVYGGGCELLKRQDRRR